jgi:hypothetical protein
MLFVGFIFGFLNRRAEVRDLPGARSPSPAANGDLRTDVLTRPKAPRHADCAIPV